MVKYRNQLRKTVMKKKSPVVRAVKKVLPAVVNISALKYLDFFEISPFSKRKRGIISKISRREKTKTGGGSGNRGCDC